MTRATTRTAIVAAIFILSFTGLSSAQLPPSATATGSSPYETLQSAKQPLSPEAVRDLVARLDDGDVRKLLLERLDAIDRTGDAQNPDKTAQFVDAFQSKAHRIRDRLGEVLTATAKLPGVFPQALEKLRDGRPSRFYFIVPLIFAVMVVVGLAAEWLFNRLLSTYRRNITDARPENMFRRFCYLMMRLGLDVVSVGVFFLVAIATYFVFYQGHEMTRTTVVTYLGAIAIVRLASVFFRFLIAPKHPALRLSYMNDDQARFLYRHGRIVAIIAVFGFLTCALLNRLGIDQAVHQLMTLMVGAVMCGWLAWTALAAKDAIISDIRGPIEYASRGRQVVAELFPRFTAAFVLLLYAFIFISELSGVPVSYLAGFGTLLTVIFLPRFDALLEQAAARIQSESDPKGGSGSQINTVLLRACRIVLFVVGALFIARIWGVDFFALAEDSAGSLVTRAAVDIGLTLLVAYVLWEIARIAIDRRLAEEMPEGDDDAAEGGDEGGVGGSRMSTLLPLVRRAVQITIGVMVVMLVLSAFGVNIGPLLAGAGVIGLAVGFGAQTLVRDIVSGVFFLVDDAFRVGEYIDVGSVKGTVEKISIRSLRLRHHRGALHTIPFGEISHLTNHSRDWVIMKLAFRVPFDTDVGAVKKIFKKIGKELLEHPEMGKDFIAPFKSQGVISTDDSALVIRGKFTAHPGRQFMIRREVYNAVQKAFAENDIEFANRQVTVHVPGADEMSSAERAAAERAAASAVAAPNSA